jgi:hypothetical protein
MGFGIRSALQGALKYSSHVLMTGIIIYQGYENYKLENQIHEIKEKVRKVSSIMLNVTKLECNAVETGLDEIINHQRQILLEGQINDYAAGIQALIIGIEAKHRNIINIRPLDKLNEYVIAINKKLNAFALPHLADETKIFTFHEIQKSLKEGMVNVCFDVPIVSSEPYIEYVVLLVPPLRATPLR